MNIGDRFGRLTVDAILPKYRVSAKCDCGAQTTARKYELLRGDTRSCGCLKREVDKTRWPTRHGFASRAQKRDNYAPEYRCWMAMRSRCSNPKTQFFYRYGGRGIRVDPRWDDYAQFLRDMGPKPSRHHTIERRDVDGPYSPENCCWIHRREQAKNTSRTRLITAHGETRTMSEWSRLNGLSPATIHRRLASGWSPERAVAEPAHW